MTPLCELAQKYKCDKAFDPSLEHCHTYTPVYHQLYDGTQDHVRAVLEVGVNTGASLRMWQEYFPQAAIIGLDIDPQCLFWERRIKCFRADQRDQASLRAALHLANVAMYDLIIDDGSHELADQITTMQYLARWLSPDGLYFIEDVRGDPGLIAQNVPPGYDWRLPDTPGGRGVGVTDKLMVLGDVRPSGSR
jgi:cephalosporin hydroxylase